MQVVIDLSIPGATGVYTTGDGGSEEGGGQQDTLVLISSSNAVAAPGAAGTAAGEVGQGEGRTQVLAIEDDSRVVELPEGDGNPFVCDAATVDVCAMAGGTIVQAHAQVCRSQRLCFCFRFRF